MTEIITGQIDVSLDDISVDDTTAESLLNRSLGLLKMATSDPDNTYAITFTLAWVSEFSLKAFLLHTGVTQRTLKDPDNRHNLVNLYNLAIEKGLNTEDPLWLNALSDQHYKNGSGYPLRYTDQNGFVDHTENLLERMVSMVNTIKREILG